jgi:hypothetical protein
MRFAANTEVSCDRSELEIRNIVKRYGAWEFVSGWRESSAMIQFRFHERAVQFVLPLPDKRDAEFSKTPTGKDRNPQSISESWERACRQRWRALALVIKAKAGGG